MTYLSSLHAHFLTSCHCAAPSAAAAEHHSDNNLPFRDTNGFRKLIVLLTASGKVFGLHSGDGRILWTHTLRPPRTTGSSSSASSGSSHYPQQYLRVWRRFHDLTHAPQLSVITAGGDESSVQVLNGHTGELLEHIQLSYGVEKVRSSGSSVSNIILLSSQESCGLYYGSCTCGSPEDTSSLRAFSPV